MAMLNFIQDNRFVTFLDRLVNVSFTYSDSSYVDLSPVGLFDGDIGTVLVKNGSDILYMENGNDTFTNISTLFPYLITPRKILLTQGINYQVTWVKNTSNGQTGWKFLRYTCPFNGVCSPCPVTYF